MGVAVPRALVGTRSPEPPQNFVIGPNLLVNCYLEIKFHNKIRVNPPPLNLKECVYLKTAPPIRFTIDCKIYTLNFPNSVTQQNSTTKTQNWTVSEISGPDYRTGPYLRYHAGLSNCRGSEKSGPGCRSGPDLKYRAGLSNCTGSEKSGPGCQSGPDLKYPVGLLNWTSSEISGRIVELDQIRDIR